VSKEASFEEIQDARNYLHEVRGIKVVTAACFAGCKEIQDALVLTAACVTGFKEIQDAVLKSCQ
jgi:hypothetical protein